jgi:hypothetical protein
MSAKVRTRQTRRHTSSPARARQPSTQQVRLPRWSWIMLRAGMALGLLLLVAACGLLIGAPNSSTASIPTADSVDVGSPRT